MNDGIYLAWAIKNCVCVSCWVALAMAFDKWWIALFGLLFMSDVKHKQGNYYRICDGCGKHSPYADSYNEALDKAKEAGWIHCVDGDRDYCPDCSKEKCKR